MKCKFKIIPLILTAMLVFSSCSESVEEPVMLENVTETKAEKPRLEDDYYGYTNWDFIDTVQIPIGKNSYGVTMMQQDLVEERINGLIDEFSESKPKKGTNEQKIKDVYLQYFDEDTRAEVGIKPFDEALDALDNVETVDDFVAVSALLFNKYGCKNIFSPSADWDAYDSSVYVITFGEMNVFRMNKNYVNDDTSINSLGDFTSYILGRLGVPEEDAKKRAADLVGFIVDVASLTLTSNELLDPHIVYNAYTKDNLSELYSNIDTKAMLKEFNISSNKIVVTNVPQAEKIVVTNVPQAEKINEYLTEDNLTLLKDYAAIVLFSEYRSALPPDYVKALDLVNENKYSKTETAREIIKLNFTQEISGIYSDRYSTESSRKEVRKMVDDIKASLRERIEQSDRLSDNGKKKLKKKLDNIAVNVADYDHGYKGDFEIVTADKGGNLLQNLINMNAYSTVYELEKIKDKPDRSKSTMPSIEVNAVYNPYLNSITIPAAFMSDYLYDSEKPYAYNLGTLGFVIGHELNHAFDSHGFLYDENGCYNEDWFSKEDKEAYLNIQQKIVEYYNNYKLLDVYRINGEETLGENIADIASIECITKLVDSKSDLKLLFEGYSYGCARVISVANMVQWISTDEHSTDEARVNAVLSSTEEFYEVYNIAKTDGMYLAPSDRVKVW